MSRSWTRCRRWGPGALSGVLLLSVLIVAPVAGSATNCFGKPATITGTAGDDTLTGTAGADVIVGLGGNDTISGLGGADRICGGAGNDLIGGGGGSDSLRGDAGNDRLTGGPGADRVLGDAGTDNLQGQAGDDYLNGGAGSDTAAGGVGTDTCVGETRSTCEVLPPTGCSNPALHPAVPIVQNVTVVGSNAFTHHSSFGICTGGICDYDYLDFRAEVRNGTGASIRLGSATIRIYDGAGSLIGKRFAGFEAGALAPGERTVLAETMPSLLYTQGEYNHFPAGWALWELVINATLAAPGAYDKLIIGGTLSSLTAGADGGLAATGTAVNTLSTEINSVSWWVVLYDSAGRLINVATDFDFLYPEGLGPLGEVAFDLDIWSWEPTCFGTVRWGASGGD